MKTKSIALLLLVFLTSCGSSSPQPQARYDRVAFAGDGPPDIEPALLVPADMRFARGALA